MEDWSIEAGKLLSREEFGYMLAASQGISYTEIDGNAQGRRRRSARLAGL